MEGLRKVAGRFLAQLWNDYRAKLPQVGPVEDHLRGKGEEWVQDHIAFRCLPGPHCGSHVLQAIFEELGYERRDGYDFPEKKLNAFWMEHAAGDASTSGQVLPKVFISELRLGSFKPEFEAIVRRCAEQVLTTPLPALRSLAAELRSGAGESKEEEFIRQLLAVFCSGPAWARLSSAQYETLRAESEYAAWTCAFGFAVNHFTVAVHELKSLKTMDEFQRYVTSQLGIPMNASGGGIVKGSSALGLEQCATLAAHREVVFQDGVRALPYAFIEFAFRHPLPGRKADGRYRSYYQAFIPDNADKIFESTNLR